MTNTDRTSIKNRTASSNANRMRDTAETFLENLNTPVWTNPGSEFSILDGKQLHVWRLSLEISTSLAEDCMQTLSADELRRASKFRFARDRNRFVAGRGQLRHLLARYGCGPARELKFAYGSEGKPFLPGQEIEFNLSHSDTLALIVFNRKFKVGIDVEHHRADFELDDLAQKNFSRHELQAFRSLPPQHTVSGFFNCWTRKEAFLKALGGGLSVPLQLFDVCLDPRRPAALVATRGHLPPMNDWSIVDLQIGTGISAAVAAARKQFVLKLWTWGD